MTGLDKILDQIKEESEEIAAGILKEAQKEAVAIKKESEEICKADVRRIEEDAAEKCDDILARGKSAAELVKRKAVLKAKQEIISQVLLDAKTSLLNLQEEKYFDLILRMIEKFALDQDGEIAFNEKDMQRMPKLFELKIKTASKNRLKPAKQPVKIDGGFVLLYGGIEENCSFKALFAGKHEQLQDEVQKLLFS